MNVVVQTGNCEVFDKQMSILCRTTIDHPLIFLHGWLRRAWGTWGTLGRLGVAWGGLGWFGVAWGIVPGLHSCTAPCCTHRDVSCADVEPTLFSP